MQTYDLVAHPTFQPAEVKGVSVKVALVAGNRLMLRYRLDGCGKLVVPPYRGIGRADDLWKTTCFELFLYDGSGRYREFNFSPSGQWAGYEFVGYRNRDGEAELREWPEIKHDTGASVFVQTVFLPQSILEGCTRAGISAVVEEKGGRPSYWALSHSGLKPDFHNPACFTARLAAPPKT